MNIILASLDVRTDDFFSLFEKRSNLGLGQIVNKVFAKLRTENVTLKGMFFDDMEPRHLQGGMKRAIHRTILVCFDKLGKNFFVFPNHPLADPFHSVMVDKDQLVDNGSFFQNILVENGVLVDNNGLVLESFHI